MKNASMVLGMASFLVLATNPCLQASLVDQSQLLNNAGNLSSFKEGMAQSFQQFANNITGAEVEITGGSGSADDVTISLYDALPSVGGVLLASGTDFGVLPGEFATVDFGGAISIVPDTTYFLVFTPTSSTLPGIRGTTSGGFYSRGQAYANAGFGSFPLFDYTFQTFAVPEPGSLSLLCMAVFGIASVTRRRRRNPHE